MDVSTLLLPMLSAVFGRDISLSAGYLLHSSGRLLVLRVFLQQRPQGAPASVILKCVDTRGLSDIDPKAAQAALLNEWAGVQFLNDCGVESAPRLYAADREHNVIVIEDIGAGTRLDHLLLEGNPQDAAAALTAFSAALGRMHARTAGRHGEFLRVCRSIGTSGRAEHDRRSRHPVQHFRAVVQALDIRPAPGTFSEIEEAYHRWTTPGPLAVYTHGDACPDNCYIAPHGVALIDYEFGGYGHALHDGVYGHLYFPSCWCVGRVPDAVLRTMEETYRTELVQGCPEAADDRLFHRAVVDACAVHVLGRHDVVSLLAQDSGWGTITLRQRVLLRYTQLARLAEERGVLEAVGSTCRAIAEQLRLRWPAFVGHVPDYPAFAVGERAAVVPDAVDA